MTSPSTEPQAEGGARPTGAAPGESRAALLVAARRLFAEHGLDRTTMRAVAREAGVDPALIYHYFPGGKQALLAATLTLPPSLPGMMSGVDREPANAGAALVARAVDVWDNHPEIREHGVAMIRIAVSNEKAGEVLRPTIQGFILGLIGGALREDGRELRAGLVLAQMQGVLLHRYVLHLPPLATASPQELVATIGPVVQHYLTGDLTSTGDLATAEDPAG